MVTASLALFLLQSPKFSNPITIEEPCISTKELMGRLSKASGLHLKATGAIADDQFAIRASGVDVQELMCRIADAESAEWKTEGPTSYLVRSASKQAEDNKRIDARLVKLLAFYRQKLVNEPELDDKVLQALNSQASEIIDHPRRDDDWVNFAGNRKNQIFSRTPLGRAFSRIAVQIAPSQLLALGTGSSVVYSSQPNRNERPLPGDFANVLQKLVYEQKIFMKLMPSFNESAQKLFKEEPSSQLLSQTSRMLFEVLYRGGGYQLEGRLVLADSAGNVLASLSGLIPGNGYFNDLKPDSATILSLDLTQSENAAAALLRQQADADYPDRRTYSPELRFALHHPELVPTGSLFAGPALLRQAEQKQQNMIAVLDDSVISKVAEAARRAFIEDLPSDKTILMHQSGWTVFRPASYEVAERQRINPTALAKLIGVVEKKNHADLSAIAEYAKASADESFDDNPLTRCYLRAIYPFANDFYLGNKFLLLKIYGSLSPEQLAGAKSSGVVKQLSSEQKRLLEKVVLQSTPYLSIVDPKDLNKELFSRWTTIQGDPFEAMADGVSTDASFKIKRKVVPSVFSFGTPAGGYQEWQPASLDGFGYFAQFCLGKWHSEYLSSSLQMGEQERIDFKFQLTPYISWNMWLISNHLTGRKYSDYNELPPALKEDFRKRAFAYDEKHHPRISVLK